MKQPILIFDMDGVLVDVTESYRETIARTVAHFAGIEITRDQIQDHKNRGGWNDDWKLTHHLIADAGADVPFEQVKEYFQDIFLGTNVAQASWPALPGNNANAGQEACATGLILRERWIARPGMLEKLNERFRFAIFTGRPKSEAELTLKRFAPGLVFDPIVGMYEVANHKPAPDGLVEIRKRYGDSKLFYIGDTPDDARCARAAGVPFIGVAAATDRRFQGEGAYAIVDDINYLPEVFA